MGELFKKWYFDIYHMYKYIHNIIIVTILGTQSIRTAGEQLILAIKLKMINQDRMIFDDFFVNFEPISVKFGKGHFLLNPKSSNKFAKLCLLFQKLDHLPCNKVLELVEWGYRGTS